VRRVELRTGSGKPGHSHTGEAGYPKILQWGACGPQRSWRDPRPSGPSKGHATHRARSVSALLKPYDSSSCPYPSCNNGDTRLNCRVHLFYSKYDVISALDRFIHFSYTFLGLIEFFTQTRFPLETWGYLTQGPSGLGAERVPRKFVTDFAQRSLRSFLRRDFSKSIPLFLFLVTSSIARIKYRDFLFLFVAQGICRISHSRSNSLNTDCSQGYRQSSSRSCDKYNKIHIDAVGKALEPFGHGIESDRGSDYY
jgi:hypothetical protein